MSVSASIITESKMDVLTVSNSAIKNQGDVNYVEVLNDDSSTPISQNITMGISNDTVTEIIDGLNAGDLVVTKTVTGTTANQTANKTPSVTSILGGGGNRMTR
jgi:hypothetical protein